MLAIILTVIVTVLISYRLYRTFNHWTIRGVKQKDVLPLLGHIGTALVKGVPLPQMLINIYKQFPENRYSGFYEFSLPILLVRDPDLLKQMGVKDFDHFTDHRSFFPNDFDPMWEKNLFSLKGDRWRQMRNTLSPSFTSSKMKAMFHLMSECGESFTNYFLKHPEDCKNVDMKDVLARYANDMIGTTAFGVKCDSLENKNNEFYLMGKEATNFGGFWQNFVIFLTSLSPNLVRIFNTRMFSEKVSKFFGNLISESIKVREEKNIVRYDMLHLLMQTRKGKQQQNEVINEGDTGFAAVQEHLQPIEKETNQISLTDDDITAQGLIFFFAGFESVSLSMTFMSYELAINPDIQKRLHEEIDDVYKKCNGKITYDALTNMKYLDMIVSETLRKYPGFFANDRTCVKPYTIAPKTLNERPVHLEKNTLIWFPVYAIHHDEKYYPEPDRFDPERFSDENKSKIYPYAYFPFGTGPRNCIGSRFALLETKILFFQILSKFELVPNKKTPIAVKLQRSAVNIKPRKSIFLTMKPRNKH